MYRLLCFLIALLTINTAIYSQQIPASPNEVNHKGERTGKWTILYDENYKEIEQSAKAAYYKIINYKDDQPIGVVKIYKTAGTIYWEGTLLQDRPEEILHGEESYFRDDGTRSMSRYYQNGQIAKFNEAIEWFEIALERTEETLGKDHPDYAHYLNCIAISSEKQGLYAKAEPLYYEALKFTKRILGEEHPYYPTVQHNLAKLYYYQGLYDKSEEFYLKVKAYNQQLGPEGIKDYATTINNLGALYYVQGKYDKVEPLFKEVVEINRETVGEKHRNYATALNNLAMVNVKQNEIEKAIPLLEEALGVYEKTLGKEHHQYTISLTNLASLNVRLKRYRDAEALYLEAMRIDEEISGKYHPTYESTVRSLAKLYDLQGLYDLAEPLYLASIQALMKQIDINFSHLSENEKIKYLDTFNDRFEAFNSFVLRRMEKEPAIIGENYKILLRTKGLLFDMQQKVKDRMLKSQDSTMLELYRSWQTSSALLANLYSRTKKEQEAEREQISEVQDKVNALEKELSGRSVLFTDANDKSRYTWQDVQARLGKQDAAIELVRFRYHDQQFMDSIVYVAMVVTAETSDYPDLVVLDNGNDLENKYFKYYQNSIAFQTKDTLSYDLYWSKLKPFLKGKRRIFISSAGVYHSINLAGILDTETNKYLIDEYDIHYLISSRYLLQDQNPEVLANEAQMIGFPDYFASAAMSVADSANQSTAAKRTTDTSTHPFGDLVITPLPGTLKEVNTIEQMLNQSGYDVTVHTKSKATEQEIKSWNSPRIVHIATHGYFLSDLPETGMAGLSNDELSNNPLLRSGLLLANAGSAIKFGGDGILTAYEAKSLNFDQTELVVLSACETGLGQLKNGEGVYGLQRAFQAAGASVVLMSLWTVNDESTQQLMSEFYHYWLKKRNPKRVALRKAQQNIRSDFSHPYYWASFVMIGD